MHTNLVNRLSPCVRQELIASGVEFRVELGSRHLKVWVGKTMAAIMPLSGERDAGGRAILNSRAQIRRAIRAEKERIHR